MLSATLVTACWECRLSIEHTFVHRVWAGIMNILTCLLQFYSCPTLSYFVLLFSYFALLCLIFSPTCVLLFIRLCWTAWECNNHMIWRAAVQQVKHGVFYRRIIIINNKLCLFSVCPDRALACGCKDKDGFPIVLYEVSPSASYQIYRQGCKPYRFLMLFGGSVIIVIKNK